MMKGHSLKVILLQDIYALQLENINGINFTRREVDILTCVLSGKTAKKVAVFLSISPKTVENHIRNIMLKIACNTQGGVIDFVEKSDKFPLVKKHYSSLLMQYDFATELKKVAKSIDKKDLGCLIVYDRALKNKVPFFRYFINHLQFVGIKVFIEYTEKGEHPCLESKIKVNHIKYVIYHLDQNLIKQFKEGDYKNNLIRLIHEISCPFVFISTIENELLTIPEDLLSVEHFSLQGKENYYLFLFEILKKLLFPINIDSAIMAFTKKHVDFYEKQKFNSDKNRTKIKNNKENIFYKIK